MAKQQKSQERPARKARAMKPEIQQGLRAQTSPLTGRRKPPSAAARIVRAKAAGDQARKARVAKKSVPAASGKPDTKAPEPAKKES